MGGGWDPLPFTTPPVAVKSGVTPGEAPGLTRVAPYQEGPLDNSGSRHMAMLAPPRAPPGTPRSMQKAPELSGMEGPAGQCLRPPWCLPG